jgi:hypothetical protein
MLIPNQPALKQRYPSGWQREGIRMNWTGIDLLGYSHKQRKEYYRVSINECVFLLTLELMPAGGPQHPSRIQMKEVTEARGVQELVVHPS